MERRANPRFVCELRAFVEDEEGKMVSGTSTDLSRGGVSIQVPDPMRAGDAVTLHLRLVLGWTAADFLSLPGTIVRSEPTSEGHRIGLKLDELPADRAGRLDLLIRVLEGELDAVIEDPRR